jgi:hypothetical protein
VPTSLPLIPCLPSKGGIRRDLSRLEAGWSFYPDCENVINHRGEFRVRLGLAKFGDVLVDLDENPSRPIGMISYPCAEENARLVVVTSTGMAHYNIGDGTWTDLTDPANPLTGGPGNTGVLRVFQGGESLLTIAVNGKDEPIVWENNDATPYRKLGCEIPRTALCQVVCNDRLVFGNIRELGANGIDFSAFNSPDTGWGVNELLLGDTPGDIVAMREFGNLNFVIYKSDATYMGIATGGSETFAFQLKSAYNVGPVGPNAVLSAGEGLHLYLGDDGGVYKFDGVQPVIFSEPLRVYIAQRLDRARAGRSFAFFDPETNLAWFVFPVQGSTEANTAVVVDLTNGAAWPMRWPARGLSCGIVTKAESGIKIGNLPLIGEMTMTFGEMASSVPAVILGGIDGQCYRKSGYTDDGDAIPFFIETGDKALGDMTAFMPVTHSLHRFNPTVSAQLVDFEIGVSEDGESLEWEGQQAFDLSEPGAHELGHRVSGLTYALRFSGQATQPVIWLLSQIGAYQGGIR